MQVATKERHPQECLPDKEEDQKHYFVLYITLTIFSCNYQRLNSDKKILTDFIRLFEYKIFIVKNGPKNA